MNPYNNYQKFLEDRVFDTPVEKPSQVKKDKKSGIVDDPNEFSDNPKYIFNLLLSIINVSMQTMDLVESLPPLEIID